MFCISFWGPNTKKLAAVTTQFWNDFPKKVFWNEIHFKNFFVNLMAIFVFVFLSLFLYWLSRYFDLCSTVLKILHSKLCLLLELFS